MYARSSFPFHATYVFTTAVLVDWHSSSMEAMVPGLNLPYGIEFTGIRQGVVGAGGKPDSGPGWREMGRNNDKKFCFASLPGGGGKEFMGQVGMDKIYGRRV